jgi:hypothetical protein
LPTILAGKSIALENLKSRPLADRLPPLDNRRDQFAYRHRAAVTRPLRGRRVFG